MDTQAEITQMFQYLGAQGIEATTVFIEELSNIIRKPNQKFIQTFSTDISIFADSKEGGKFKELSMHNADWKKIIGEAKMYRYEYRKDYKNLRCLFVVDENGICVFLKAFVEDGGKKKGSKSYNTNIELALRDYKIRREENDE